MRKMMLVAEHVENPSRYNNPASLYLFVSGLSGNDHTGTTLQAQTTGVAGLVLCFFVVHKFMNRWARVQAFDLTHSICQIFLLRGRTNRTRPPQRPLRRGNGRKKLAFLGIVDPPAMFRSQLDSSRVFLA